jgi:outer membrane protein
MNFYKYFILFLIALFSLHIPSYAINEIELNDNQNAYTESNRPLVSSISFDDVLKKAESHSYDLKIADFNILISKQDIRSSRSEYFPKLNVSAGTEYTKNFRDINETTIMSIGDAFINPYTRYQSVFGITLSYNVFDFGVRKGRMDIAKEDVKLKELEEQQQLQELNLNLLDNYSKILITGIQIELNKQILELAEKNLELKKRLRDAQEISSTELNDQQTEVNVLQSRIMELYQIFAESVNWLSFYTGENYNAENLTIDELKKPDFNVMEFKDYTKSIIWQIHEKNLKKKELEVKIAKRNYLPKVTAYSRYYVYGSDHSSYPKAFSSIEPSNFTVGGSINMPVFDGFQNSANVRKAELEYKQLQIERDKAIAELMTRLAVMRSNLMYLDEQTQANTMAVDELKEKVKSLTKLSNKKVISPIEENEGKIELLQRQIELEKNRITAIAITKGIQILTDY